MCFIINEVNHVLILKKYNKICVFNKVKKSKNVSFKVQL